jgi:hypothetical protein
MAGNQQGTGKHPHKDTKEPWAHTDDNQRGRNEQHASSQSHAGQKPSSESASLKRREYSDEQGQEHHHTKTYMDQHGGKK